MCAKQRKRRKRTSYKSDISGLGAKIMIPASPFMSRVLVHFTSLRLPYRNHHETYSVLLFATRGSRLLFFLNRCAGKILPEVAHKSSSFFSLLNKDKESAMITSLTVDVVLDRSANQPYTGLLACLQRQVQQRLLRLWAPRPLRLFLKALRH